MVNPAFSAQHKRLLIELLRFTDSQQLLEWIRSPYVLGAWGEFRDDFLMHIEPHEFEQPDKTTVCQAVNDVLHSRDPKYRIYHPVKTSWTAYDHTVRFILSVTWDNFFGGLWSLSDFNERPKHYLSVAYEILSLLYASLMAEEPQERVERRRLLGHEEAYDKPNDETLCDEGPNDNEIKDENYETHSSMR